VHATETFGAAALLRRLHVGDNRGGHGLAQQARKIVAEGLNFLGTTRLYSSERQHRQGPSVV
jgi:hypothetical protein